MRIVKLDEFLACPPGTLFSKYELCNFGPLSIKGETWRHAGSTGDFLYQQVADAIDCADFTDTLLDYKEGQVLGIDLECESRDGMFEPDQLFAVWDREDVGKLLVRLARAAAEGYGARSPEVAP